MPLQVWIATVHNVAAIVEIHKSLINNRFNIQNTTLERSNVMRQPLIWFVILIIAGELYTVVDDNFVMFRVLVGAVRKVEAIR